MSTATPGAVPIRDRLPLSQLVTLSIYWLGIQTIWGGLNITIIPGRLDDLSRDTQGTLLAVIMIAGAVAPIIIQPTVGLISDYTVTRWGRRKPYIVIGALLDVVFLAGIAFNNDFVAMVAFYFLLQVSSNLAQGPFQGYVPDLVPAKQVGLASGLMGLMLTLGTIVGRRDRDARRDHRQPRAGDARPRRGRGGDDGHPRRHRRRGPQRPAAHAIVAGDRAVGVVAATSFASATSCGSSSSVSSSWAPTTRPSSPSATSAARTG